MALVEDIGYRGLTRVGIFSYIAHGEQLLEVLREKYSCRFLPFVLFVCKTARLVLKVSRKKHLAVDQRLPGVDNTCASDV